MKSFEYHETRSVQETIEILSSEEETRILAGGCGLLLLIKEKLFVPRAIVNIKKIPGLKYVTQKNGHIAIGTLTTHNEVKDAPAVAEKIPLLSEALGYVATDRIRNMATLGGTLTYADPTSDAAPALLALGARVKAEGKGGEREIALEDFFEDYFETVLPPDEMLTEIIVPVQPDRCGAYYTRFEVRKAMDKAMPGIAVLLVLEDDLRTIKVARIGMSGVGNKCIRLPEAEAFLQGKEDHEEIRRNINEIVKHNIDPIDDYHYSAEYKKEVSGVLMERVFTEAYRRATNQKS